MGSDMTESEHKSVYWRLVDYLKRHHPSIITIARAVKWGLATLKNTFFGVGGLALLVVAGLYIAGAFIEAARWYLVGVASALLLLCGLLLAVLYARSVLNRITGDQQSMKNSLKGLSTLSKEVADSRNTLAKMNVVNFSLFQRFNRRLTSDDLKRFAEEWAPKLRLNVDAGALGYMAHHICLAEDTCTGRLAGDIEDMLLRILIARSIKEPELNILEIGTLFGVSMAIVYDNCKDFFAGVHVTIIDPLRGYYDKSLDPMTGMPVTRDTFARNMQRMDIPETDYTIIQELSTDSQAIEQASKRRYNMLIIDGDHSYSGVKLDFINYSHLVKPGGYIVFDNYNDPSFPGIQDFVDNEVVGLPNLELVGTDGITAVFRVISSQG